MTSEDLAAMQDRLNEFAATPPAGLTDVDLLTHYVEKATPVLFDHQVLLDELRNARRLLWCARNVEEDAALALVTPARLEMYLRGHGWDIDARRAGDRTRVYRRVDAPSEPEISVNANSARDPSPEATEQTHRVAHVAWVRAMLARVAGTLARPAFEVLSQLLPEAGPWEQDDIP